MAAITTSTIIESVPNGGTQRNRYRYVLDTGETHERTGWIPAAADANADMAARGAILLDELARAEFEALIGNG